MEISIESNDLQSSNLQLAWLLSTLGSKSTIRNRMMRKDNLLSISIPKLCESILKQTESRDIRWLSNIMHGISIIYNSKINYFMNDLNFIQMRLKHNYNQIIINNEIKPTLKRVLLIDDPNFDINQDMSVIDQPECVKRRKLAIKQFDLNIFPNFTIQNINVNVETRQPFIINSQATKIDLVEDVDLQDFIIENNNDEDDHVVPPDFDLDFNQDQNMDIEINFNPIDLLDEIEENNAQEIQQEEQIGQDQGTISNDANFALTTEQTTEQQQNDVNSEVSAPRLRNNRLIIDTEIDLSTYAFDLINDNYESRMLQNQIQRAQYHEPVYSGVYQSTIPLVQYIQRITTNNNSTLNSTSLNTTTYHSILQNSLVRDVRNIDVFQRNENVQTNVIEETRREISPDLEFRNDVFDIDIPYPEDDEIQNEIIEEFVEEEESYTGSIIDDSLNTKLNKFLKYLIKRCQTNKEILFSELVPFVQVDDYIDDDDKLPVGKRVAINSFSSVLALASTDLIEIEVLNQEDYKLVKPQDIRIRLINEN
ncbi:unnamed protein product [Candida verbasci]|uniref:Rad21/Rec8-like protein N-terminal domain-containing protein n=1 Tax=Candida verbasci TaxID=1227364 RepID=A0A9W4TVJ9_9ASCO|nr:unnamed protein product [Candida verbasci]